MNPLPQSILEKLYSLCTDDDCVFGLWINALFSLVEPPTPHLSRDLSFPEQKEAFLWVLERLLREGRVLLTPPPLLKEQEPFFWVIADGYSDNDPLRPAPKPNSTSTWTRPQPSIPKRKSESDSAASAASGTNAFGDIEAFFFIAFLQGRIYTAVLNTPQRGELGREMMRIVVVAAAALGILCGGAFTSKAYALTKTECYSTGSASICETRPDWGLIIGITAGVGLILWVITSEQDKKQETYGASLDERQESDGNLPTVHFGLTNEKDPGPAAVINWQF